MERPRHEYDVTHCKSIGELRSFLIEANDNQYEIVSVMKDGSCYVVIYDIGLRRTRCCRRD